MKKLMIGHDLRLALLAHRAAERLKDSLGSRLDEPPVMVIHPPEDMRTRWLDLFTATGDRPLVRLDPGHFFDDIPRHLLDEPSRPRGAWLQVADPPERARAALREQAPDADEGDLEQMAQAILRRARRGAKRAGSDPAAVLDGLIQARMEALAARQAREGERAALLARPRGRISPHLLALLGLAASADLPPLPPLLPARREPWRRR
jgi:hypothetical protein